MSETQFNKKYLEYTKEEAKNWHLYMGGTPSVKEADSPAEFDWGRDVNFLYRIRENDINFITNRRDWNRRITALPWGVVGSSSENNMVYNPFNNIVYICVSDNLDNRSDGTIKGKNFSFFIPSHTIGEETYPDGYKWCALFLVDPEKIDLISNKYLPVPTINDFDEFSTNSTLESKYRQICGSSYKTQEGVCCLYNKENTIDGVGITYEQGSLIPISFLSQCYECYETAEKMNLSYSFVAGATLPPNRLPTSGSCSPCPCSIDVLSDIDILTRTINTLNPSGSIRHLYDSYEYWKENKSGIFSVFINLETLTEEERTVPFENPQIVFDSISGTGASARLKTIGTGTGHYVTGIELVSRGKDYEVGYVSPSIVGITQSPLLNKIEVNVMPEDFPENPSTMLSILKTCIKASVDNIMINEFSDSDISEFTTYGLISGVKLTNTDLTATTSLNKNEFQILRTTTKVKLIPDGTPQLSGEQYISELPIDSKSSITFSGDETKKAQVAVINFKTSPTQQIIDVDLELITKNYDNIKVGDKLDIGQNENYTVTEINKPDVIYGSGTPLIIKNSIINFPTKSEIAYKPQKAVTFTIIKS